MVPRISEICLRHTSQMTKDHIRKATLQKLTCLSKEKRIASDAAICEHLHALTPIQHAQSIGVYYPVGHEVNIKPFITRLWEKNIRVYFPAADEIGVYSMCLAQSFDDLSESYKGIYQPAVHMCTHSLDCILLPGVAFDRQGNRIGRGSGHYDRLLSTLDPTLIVGVSYQTAIQKEQIPSVAHDVRCHILITEIQQFMVS